MGTEVTTEMMNEAIARFMGINPIPAGTIRLGDIKPPNESIAFLSYHEKWELLMPVVEKITKMATSGDAINGITENIIFSFSIFAPLKDVHNAVYKFITWYNHQKQTNEQSAE